MFNPWSPVNQYINYCFSLASPTIFNCILYTFASTGPLYRFLPSDELFWNGNKRLYGFNSVFLRGLKIMNLYVKEAGRHVCLV